MGQVLSFDKVNFLTDKTDTPPIQLFSPNLLIYIISGSLVRFLASRHETVKRCGTVVGDSSNTNELISYLVAWM